MYLFFDSNPLKNLFGLYEDGLGPRFAKTDAESLIFSDLLLPFLLFNLLSHKVAPAHETGLEEHLSQEQVDWHTLNGAEEGILLVSFRKFTMRILQKCDLSDTELSDKFTHSHDFIEFEIDCCHELSSHDSVKHLIEENEAIIDIDAHLENSSIDFLIFSAIADSHFLAHSTWQLLKELMERLRLNLNTLVSIGEILPGFLKVIEVFFETFQWVIAFKVILGKLLDDNQDEEVEHYMGNHHYKANEIQWCKVPPTRLPLDAVRWRLHAIVHEPIPVFTRSDGK